MFEAGGSVAFRRLEMGMDLRTRGSADGRPPEFGRQFSVTHARVHDVSEPRIVVRGPQAEAEAEG
ncbi:hypothetical protein Aca07nite_86960 [Actinoplanes capillaceus]|uniref:Uncharacterized protein n=1 Tax=Actinoplanes campanulatus TaxID=113559 RepID=A0ABQ3WYQ7_9ACTN|nr:hypothetical protein Aca07nite_86960 [Actinoplanes capillaceus]